MVFTNRDAPERRSPREIARAGRPAAPLSRRGRAVAVAGAALAGIGCLLLFLGLTLGPHLAGG